MVFRSLIAAVLLFIYFSAVVAQSEKSNVGFKLSKDSVSFLSRTSIGGYGNAFYQRDFSSKTSTVNLYTHADIGGYKTEPCNGFEDFWVLRFDDTTSIATNVELNTIGMNDFSAYPNPLSNSLYVKLDSKISGEATIKIYDVFGHTVYSNYTSSEFNGPIPASLFPAGVYILEYQQAEERTP